MSNFKDILQTLTERDYSKESQINVWSAPISNTFFASGNDSSQYNLTNQDLRDYARSNQDSGYITASLKTAITASTLDTRSWMTTLWSSIKEMPAREFLFLGCHDALASYGGPDEGYGAQTPASPYSFNQDRTITAMLNDGCRFLDLRFKGAYGHHSSVDFNVTQDQVVQELSNFFTISGNNEMIVISLDIRDGNDNSSPSVLTTLYQDFHNLLIGYANSIFPIAFDSNMANPASTLEQLRSQGNVLFLVNNGVFEATPGWTPPSTIFWSGQSQDAVSSYGTALNVMDYYNDIIENGYVSDLLNGNVFNYLSLKSSGEKSGSSNNDLAQKMNGPMADWLLNATELNNSMLTINDGSISVSTAAKTVLNHYGFEKLTLPFKTTNNGGTLVKNRNFNLVGVNYYEIGPFVINAIAQNIMSALFIASESASVIYPMPPIYPGSPVILGVPPIGSLQNLSNGGFRTDAAQSLDSNYNPSCKLAFIPYGNNIYAIENLNNNGYYQDSIGSLASSVDGDGQKWNIIPSGTGPNEYYIQNVSNDGYMTSSASQLSDNAGYDEIWIIEAR